MTSDLGKLAEDAKNKIDKQVKRVERRVEQIGWLQHYGYICKNGVWSAPPIGNRKRGRRFPSANVAYRYLSLDHLPEIWQQ